jgi:hypothetical protein
MPNKPSTQKTSEISNNSRANETLTFEIRSLLRSERTAQPSTNEQEISFRSIL